MEHVIEDSELWGRGGDTWEGRAALHQQAHRVAIIITVLEGRAAAEVHHNFMDVVRGVREGTLSDSARSKGCEP